MDVNRREFLEVAGGAVGATLAGQAASQTLQHSKEIDDLFDRSIVIDTLSSYGGEGTTSWSDPKSDAANLAAIKQSGYT
ncbi:MAG: hypothetical protein HYX76_11015, partial [Acidobacteria bacterium]|nr:hypothetical protein [Acidobacteriota bacterium]